MLNHRQGLKALTKQSQGRLDNARVLRWSQIPFLWAVPMKGIPGVLPQQYMALSSKGVCMQYGEKFANTALTTAWSGPN